MAKSCFLRRREIQFRRSRWLSEVLAHKKNFHKRITQQGIVDEDLLWSGGGVFHIQKKLRLQFVSGRQKAADYLKMLNDLLLTQEECRLCGEEFIFQQDNAAILNASITRKYLLEEKIRLLHYPAYSPDLSPLEKLSGLILAKVYEGGRQYSAISELKNASLDARKKYLRFNFRN